MCRLLETTSSRGMHVLPPSGTAVLCLDFAGEVHGTAVNVVASLSLRLVLLIVL